jgi:zinc protease
MNVLRAYRRIHVMGLALATFALAASAALAERTKVTEVEGITEYRYDNGLKLVLFPDNSKPTVTVNITYFVGSRHEGRGEKGMAHLLEHMVFKGTPDHPEIWKALEDHGARFNGTTWTDRTNYFETLPTTEPDNLEWALKMEADRMINSFVRQEDLDTEMTVVRNEFEMGENSPTSVLMERMMSTAYLWHNYGDSTIGNRSDIERVPIKNLKAFYKKYYQPDNAMLVVAGDFKPDEALTLVDKHFGSIPRPDRVLDETYTVEPVQDGARRVELRRTGDVAACGSAYHVCAASHADFPAIEVIEEVLAAEPSGRLYKALVESGMAASVSTFAFGWKEPGLLMNLASVRKEQPIDPVMEKLIEIVEGIGGIPVTEEEFKRAQTKLLKNIDLALKNSQRIAVGLSNWAGSGDWRLFFLHRDRLEALKLEDVQRVASRYFKSSNRTTGVFYPTQDITRTEVPDTPNVELVLKDYRGKAALAKGEEFELTPVNIESRVKRFEMPNGMKLALLAKETRGDEVQAQIAIRYGTEKDIQGRQTATRLMGDLMMRGCKKYDHQQLKDKFDELKAQVGMFGSDGMLGVNVQTDREHIRPVLELVAEVLQTPTFPKEEFEIVKKEGLAQLEEQLQQPMSLAFRSVTRRLNPWPSDNVRYVPTIAESIERLEAVELDNIKAVYGKLVGASFAQMTVVGDFDPDEIKPVIEKSLGNWKSPKPFERIEQVFRGDVSGSDDVILTPDKKMAMVGCAVNFPLRDDDPEYAAMELANYVLGASAKSRLLDRLRQKEGLSYGARSMLQAHNQDRDGALLGYAICAPENAHKAYDSMLDEFRRLVEEGVGQADLDDAKKSYALQAKTRFANDGSIARALNEGLYVDRTLEYYRKLDEKIAALTPPQVKDALRKFVQLERFVKVKAGDLQSASPQKDGAETGTH